MSEMHERRELNDEIETTYINITILAAKIDTYFHTRSPAYGTIIDLYAEFYFNMKMLVGLTSKLGEMKEEKQVIDDINNWLDKNYCTDEKKIEIHYTEGQSALDSFKSAINKNGLISLPNRR